MSLLWVAGTSVVQAMQGKSRKGRTVDALAYRGDEGRAKLRKAAGSCKEALIRGVRMGQPIPIYRDTPFEEGTRGELKHLSTLRNRKQ
jgi:hypothetical protein